MSLSDITVAVSTCADSLNFGRYLASLPKEVKLIVVDRQAPPNFLIDQAHPRLQQLIRKQCSPSEARQIAADAATTPWLLFSDVDVIFPNGYFARIRRHLTFGEKYGAIYGPKVSAEKISLTNKLTSLAQYSISKIGIPAALGSNLLIHRQSLKSVGGFDLSLESNQDTEIVWRLKRYYYSTYFDPQLIVHTLDKRYDSLQKAAYDLVRCGLLYWKVMPGRWRSAELQTGNRINPYQAYRSPKSKERAK